MKSIAKKPLITLLVLVISIGFSYFTKNYSESSMRNGDNTSYYANLNSSKTSDKIHIMSNSGWLAFRNTGNCSGEGTYSNPYVIKDLVIDGGGSGSCILIEDSDVYFRIENCTFNNAGSSWLVAGISLRGVTNSHLINNAFSYNNGDGIVLYQSHNNTIMGNNESNCEDGIYLYQSNSNNISRNTVYNNSANGMFIEESIHNTITGNNALSNTYKGIRLTRSRNNTVSGNTANNNYENGITLEWSDNNTISGNLANDNYEGFLIFESNTNTVLGNTITSNDADGIFVWESDFNNIIGNTVNYNEYGIYSLRSRTNGILRNQVNFNVYGIFLKKSHYNNISENTVTYNEHGIYSECSCYNILIDNILIHNTIADYYEEQRNCCNRSILIIPGFSSFFLLGSLFIATLIIRARLQKSLKIK